MIALTPASNTGIDMEVAMNVERDVDTGFDERFIYPNGRARYNTHITSATNYCACGGTLCPHYLRLRASPLFTFVRKGRNAFLDTFATIVGFASACATAGIPLGIMLRSLIGIKYTSWEYWLNKEGVGKEPISMDCKSPG
mmetsp:Transcript_23124/g.32320  ORF Transcript_23124/g.32320 Transcript_23124/m.32320 type:complete len:140 (-) Transcript_23124:338-757(-)